MCRRPSNAAPPHIINGVTIDTWERSIQHRGKSRSFRRSSMHRGVTFKFLCNLIQYPARTLEEHFDMLYGHLESGGPEMGVNQLHHLVHRLRPVLLKLDLEIIAVRMRRSSSNRCAYSVIAVDKNVEIAA